MNETSIKLRQRLRALGLSDPAISAAWPPWWSEDADASNSARADLKFALSRRLGLDPRSLLAEEDEPRFTWHDAARFKHLSGETESERAAISSFGVAVATLLLAGTPSHASIVGTSALDLRRAVLANRPFVTIRDLLALCWSVGIPVGHLRVFPLGKKRMAAMCVQVGGRYALLLGRDSEYPAHLAFYIAHELGHIGLGHLATGSALVDFERAELTPDNDPEESDADQFALTILTGQQSPTIEGIGANVTGRRLAASALSSAESIHIEPGTIALCYGYSSGDWQSANAAMKHIYTAPKPVWKEVNAVAKHQLDLDLLPDDAQPFVGTVLGWEEDTSA